MQRLNLINRFRRRKDKGNAQAPEAENTGQGSRDNYHRDVLFDTEHQRPEEPREGGNVPKRKQVPRQQEQQVRGRVPFVPQYHSPQGDSRRSRQVREQTPSISSMRKPLSHSAASSVRATMAQKIESKGEGLRKHKDEEERRLMEEDVRRVRREEERNRDKFNEQSVTPDMIDARWREEQRRRQRGGRSHQGTRDEQHVRDKRGRRSGQDERYDQDGRYDHSYSRSTNIPDVEGRQRRANNDSYIESSRGERPYGAGPRGVDSRKPNRRGGQEVRGGYMYSSDRNGNRPRRFSLEEHLESRKGIGRPAPQPLDSGWTTQQRVYNDDLEREQMRYRSRSAKPDGNLYAPRTLPEHPAAATDSRGGRPRELRPDYTYEAYEVEKREVERIMINTYTDSEKRDERQLDVRFLLRSLSSGEGSWIREFRQFKLPENLAIEPDATRPRTTNPATQGRHTAKPDTPRRNRFKNILGRADKPKLQPLAVYVPVSRGITVGDLKREIRFRTLDGLGQGTKPKKWLERFCDMLETNDCSYAQRSRRANENKNEKGETIRVPLILRGDERGMSDEMAGAIVKDKINEKILDRWDYREPN